MLTCCTCGCAPTVCWVKGFVAFLPVLRSPAGSGYAGSCGFSSPIWFTTFVMGHPCGVEAGLSSIGTKVWYVFSFPFGLFLRIVTALRDIVTIWVRCVGRFPLMRDQRLSLVLRPFSFWMGFALCLRLFFAPCRYRRISWWPSLRPRIFSCPCLAPVFFPVPCYGYMSASMTLAPGLKLSLVPYPRSMGLEPLLEAPLSALQLPARSFLVVLAEAASLREFLDLSFVLPIHHCSDLLPVCSPD